MRLCVCVSKISETTKYKALKKAKKSKFLCCAGLAGYVIANCFTAAKVRHLFRIAKKILKNIEIRQNNQEIKSREQKDETIAKEKESVPINTPSFISNPILSSPPLEGLGEVFTYPLGTMGLQEQP